MGYPCWTPEPCPYPPGHASKGVSIGDVGFITFDGDFKFLFNLFLPRDDRRGINVLAPPDFEPMQELEKSKIEHPGPVILSQGVHPKISLGLEDDR
jgi:hypothetical protein